MTPLLALLLAILAIALVAVLWRLASRRRSLPCPVWLRWLVELDNPFTKTNRAPLIRAATEHDIDAMIDIWLQASPRTQLHPLHVLAGPRRRHALDLSARRGKLRLRRPR